MAPVRPERRDYPIFVVGLGRSGSTLVGEVLNHHPRIAIADETWLVNRAASEVASLYTGHGNGLGTERDVLVRAWRAWLCTLYEAYAARQGAHRWGEKCPGDARAAEIVDELLERRCLFLWTVRHPLDLALSWLERWPDPATFFRILGAVHDVRGFTTTRHDMVRAVFEAYRAHTFCLRRLRRRCGARVRVCRYERIVSSPVHELSRIHAFLGEDFDAAQLDLAFGPERRVVRGGDPKFNATRGVHRGSSERWRTLGAAELDGFREPFREFEIAACMSYLGYADAAAELSRRFENGVSRVEATG